MCPIIDTDIHTAPRFAQRTTHNNRIETQMQHSARTPFFSRPPLWLYHELTHDQWRRPEYENVCLETVQRHCAHSFQIVPLDRYSIYKYVPDLPGDVWVKCSPAQRMDLMKWELLSRYGGLFLDADVVVLRDLLPVLAKLKDHDCVVFGQDGGGSIRTYSTPTSPSMCPPVVVPKPLTWAIASRPAGRLVTMARNRAYWLIHNDPHRLYVSPHAIGRETMWHCMEQLRHEAVGCANAQSWSYFHVSSVCAEQDRFGRPYTKDRLLQDGVYDKQCIAKGALIVPLNPNGGRTCGFPMWFVKASREKLLGEMGQTVVGGLWRRSLGEGSSVPH